MTTNAMAPSRSARPSSRFSALPWRRILAWATGLIAVYVLLGFLVLPWGAKSLLQSQLGEALHRPVSIGQVKFNPFTLEAEVRGFAVHGAEGQPEVLGFDRLYADVAAASLVKGGIVVRELLLEGPRLHVTRLTPERYDVSDLIEAWSKPSDGGPPPRFSLSNIQVSGGKVVFVDKPKGRTHEISDLTLRLPFLSSLPYQADLFVEPHFSARVNGAPLLLTGRSKPFAASHESELSLDLDRVELAPYLPYSPFPLPFAVRGGSLDTELKLVFRQEPEKPGTLKLVGALHLKDLVVRETAGAPLLAWKRLDVTLHEADLLRRHFAVDRVEVVGLDGQVRRGANGRINWLDLKFPAGKGNSPSAPVTWSVREVRLEDGRLSYQDEALPGGGKPLVADRIAASVKGLSNSAAKLAVALKARMIGEGSLQAEGEVDLQPLAVSLDLEAANLPILPAQPYFGERLNLTLARGQLSGRGHLILEPGEDGLGGGFKGQLTLGDVASVDKATGNDFLKWKSLFVGDIDARLKPFSLAVGDVAVSDFYARLVVSPQGRLNLLQIVRSPEAPPPPAVADKATVGRETTATVPPSPSREVLPIRIGKISLQGGTVNFSDFFVKPNYTVNVTRIGGRISGLSSAPNTLADLELRGSYGNTAPVQVQAKLNPLAARTYLDLKGEIRGVDLTTLSAYSGKYAGYAIERGKLSLFVTYRLDHDQLTAQNRVFLDQLAFGAKVDSPQATSLPVKLAVALLQNSRGEIDVNLPVAGSIDDPEFSIGGVLLRVIGNLIVKTVTAPFAFLGSIFGGGAELSSIDFAPGYATLDTPALKKLEALARAMEERPRLKLEIGGRADPDADREGLKRAALERAVKAEKAKDQKKPVAALDSLGLTPQEYGEYLRRAYRAAKFPKPRNLVGLQKDLPLEEMEKLMLAHQPAGDAELEQLAGQRADVVLKWLSDQGKVPMERLFLLPPKVGDDEKGKSSSRVDFSLH